MIKIALIRHGKTYGNTFGRYIGVTDEPLCEEGIRQMSDRVMDTVDLVFVSPMTRCIQSAELLYPYARRVQIPEFRECNFGDFENKNYQELQSNPEYQKWVDSMATLAFPNGESPDQFQKRCVKGFDNMVDTCIRRHYKNVACEYYEHLWHSRKRLLRMAGAQRMRIPYLHFRAELETGPQGSVYGIRDQCGVRLKECSC